MCSYLNCLLPLEKQFWKAIRTRWFRKSSMEFSEGVNRIFACPSSHKYLFNDKIDQHNLWNCFTLLTKISSITPKKFEIGFQWKLCGNFLTATHLAFLKGHSQLVYMRIRYHFIANLYITLHLGKRVRRRK